MKFPSKKIIFLLTSILLGVKLFAQTPDTIKDYVQPFSGDDAFRTWSIGVHTGVLTFSNILETPRELNFKTQNSKVGYGAYIKKQILPSFAIQTDFLAGSLSGTTSQSQIPGVPQFNAFNTKLQYAASLSAVFNLANINWHYNQFGIQPYVTVGFGNMNYIPVLTYPNGTVSDFKDNNNGVVNAVFLPAQLGFKFNISRGINIEVAYQLNIVFANNVDGDVWGLTNDKFSYAHIGLEFALGKHSKPQLSTHNPVSSMRHEYLMQNQNIRTQMQTKIDSVQSRNDQLQKHVADMNDKFDKLTMDSDSDGVSDYFDKCPNTPPGTVVDGSGCPLVLGNKTTKVYVTEKDGQIIKEAIKSLEFDLGKATIRPKSFPSLDQVAQLLKEKKLNLKLSGYTDATGPAATNLRISRQRAEAVRAYLVSKGVNPSNIFAEGFGSAHPIATNKTAAGRQINRRVEFALY